jgi:hypothetical protein
MTSQIPSPSLAHCLAALVPPRNSSTLGLVHTACERSIRHPLNSIVLVVKLGASQLTRNLILNFKAPSGIQSPYTHLRSYR